MSEINGRGAAELAAGRKITLESQGVHAVAVCEMPATYTAAAGNTVGSGIVIKRGSRLLCPVTLSNAANNAGLMLSVGLRNAQTRVVIDATAILPATAINAASTQQLNTGTRLTAGQRYVLDQDAEIYFTFSGATPNPNVPIRVEVPYISP